MKPTQEAVNLFLDDLRLSGTTNMFGAVPYIRAEYPNLTAKEASGMLTEWMRTFAERSGQV